MWHALWIINSKHCFHWHLTIFQFRDRRKIPEWGRGNSAEYLLYDPCVAYHEGWWLASDKWNDNKITSFEGRVIKKSTILALNYSYTVYTWYLMQLAMSFKVNVSVCYRKCTTDRITYNSHIISCIRKRVIYHITT